MTRELAKTLLRAAPIAVLQATLREMTAPLKKVLLGLIGAGIQQSLTPAMQEEEGRHHGLDVHYQLIDCNETGFTAAQLPALLQAAQHMGFAGVNVTHPFKQAVISLLDELSDEARLIGAVNTVVFQGGRKIGYNTDCPGFASAFLHSFATQPKSHAVQFGSGGAGAAVAHAALRSGVETLSLIDLDTARRDALVADLRGVYGSARIRVADDARDAVPAAQGIINATPMGMANYPGMAFDAALLRPDLWVAEIVYFPLETALLRAARNLGAPTMDGGGMAVGQAADAFDLFHQTTLAARADAARMSAHFRRMVTA